MIKLDLLFWLVGAIFAAMACQMALDRTNPKRYTTAAFWGLLAFAFIYSNWVDKRHASPAPLGAAVIGTIVIGGLGLVGRGESRIPDEQEREASSRRIGPWLFVPPLVVPAVTILFAEEGKYWHTGSRRLLEPGSETFVGLAVGVVLALILAMALTRTANPVTPLHAGRGLLESMGWTPLLPQLLAVLGAIFVTAGVGTQVGKLTTHVIPHGDKLLAVVVYCVGMALFTVIMGNAFAAFPVMTAAIGWPILVQQQHGHPAVVLAVGMLAGFCGTLVTPMAANFNLVPATLLELKDQYGPIKAQIPTAGALLVCNIAIMAVWGF